MTILEAEKITGCPALPLAVAGWSEILSKGLSGDGIALSWDQSVLWIELNDKPVAVIVWQYQEYRSEVWIALSYVAPESRGNSLFRALYNRLVEIAIAKKARRIAGGINLENYPMRAAAEACGRKADYVVYAQSVPTPEKPL